MYSRQKSLERITKIVKVHSENNTDNLCRHIKKLPYDEVIEAEYFPKELLSKLLHVINRSTNNWEIKPNGNRIQIVFSYVSQYERIQTKLHQERLKDKLKNKHRPIQV